MIVLMNGRDSVKCFVEPGEDKTSMLWTRRVPLLGVLPQIPSDCTHTNSHVPQFNTYFFF